MRQGEKFGHDYFKDLLEDIREIRASERRFYQKITDIYALSVDYDKHALEQNVSLHQYRINYTGLYLVRRQLRLYMTMLMPANHIWD